MRDVSPIRSENPVGAFLERAKCNNCGGRCPPQSRRMRIPAGQFTSFLGLAGAHAAPSAIVDIPDHLHTTIRRNQVFSVEESSICTASKIIEIQYIIEKKH